MTVDEIVKEYPTINKRNVLAAIKYATQVFKKQELVFA
jgi:uncharacterized protein (DUF433 family)